MGEAREGERRKKRENVHHLGSTILTILFYSIYLICRISFSLFKYICKHYVVMKRVGLYQGFICLPVLTLLRDIRKPLSRYVLVFNFLITEYNNIFFTNSTVVNILM